MMAKFSLDLSLLATTNKNLIILWKNYNQHVYTLTHPSIKQLQNFFLLIIQLIYYHIIAIIYIYGIYYHVKYIKHINLILYNIF